MSEWHTGDLVAQVERAEAWRRHPGWVVCGLCGWPVDPAGLVRRGGVCLHVMCELCRQCRRPLTDDEVTGGVHTHPGCTVCEVCQQPLTVYPLTRRMRHHPKCARQARRAVKWDSRAVNHAGPPRPATRAPGDGPRRPDQVDGQVRRGGGGRRRPGEPRRR